MEDQYLQASVEYLQHRHEIALRLLAECDKQATATDTASENELRDLAMIQLVKRDYLSAAATVQALAAQHGGQQHILQRRQQLRLECDRLCSAKATLEQRQELLDKTSAATIEDPYIGGVGAYLEKRHETALRLVAALDAEKSRQEASGKAADSQEAQSLQLRRDRLSIEIDTLQQALQVHEQREELLSSADGVLGEGAPDTAAYLRRVVAYLEARSAVVLKLIASIDAQLGAAGTEEASKAHLTRQRAELVTELDQINENIAVQKKGEAELKACGLARNGDPYHAKVTTYLENRSDVALQLIAFLDQKLGSLDQADPKREQIASQRDALLRQADEALAQIAQQKQGQVLMDQFGVAAKVDKSGYV